MPASVEQQWCHDSGKVADGNEENEQDGETQSQCLKQRGFEPGLLNELELNFSFEKATGNTGMETGGKREEWVQIFGWPSHNAILARPM